MNLQPEQRKRVVGLRACATLGGRLTDEQRRLLSDGLHTYLVYGGGRLGPRGIPYFWLRQKVGAKNMAPTLYKHLFLAPTFLKIFPNFH